MNDMTVAKTILQQLGNNKFIAMTGSKNFVGDANSLSFTFPTKNKCNICKITLNSLDLYDVEFSLIRRKNHMPTIKSVKTYNGVYFDQLQNIFTIQTGLYTTL